MQEISDNVTYLCGNKGSLDRLSSLRRLPPFDGIVCDFLGELSGELLRDSEGKKYPDVVTFGFFCRRGNIGRLREDYSGRISDRPGRLGRGVSFHIAPSNVPINFGYSFVAGLLAGNICIVRASSKQFPQVDIVCRCINKALENEKFSELREYIHVIRYPRDKGITDLFSSLSDVRIIWGGDETVAEIRTSPLPPRAAEITFADRYSLAVIDPAAVNRCETIDKLAGEFYNDTYLFDQNACSSPRLIYWLGNEGETAAAKEKFWGAVHRYVSEKYTAEPVIAVDKYTAACRLAIDLEGRVETMPDNLVNRISVPDISDKLPDYRCAGGSFIEYCSESLDELERIVTEKVQTVSYYGELGERLGRFVLNRGLRGIDRIVPVGKTADFSLVWDGYDLILQMSRAVSY